MFQCIGYCKSLHTEWCDQCLYCGGEVVKMYICNCLEPDCERVTFSKIELFKCPVCGTSNIDNKITFKSK